MRFSLGGYIAAGKEGMKIFSAEIEDAFSIFIRYWTRFAAERADEANKGVESKDLLERVFYSPKDQDFIDSLIRDYKLSAQYKKDKAPSLQIRDVRSLYHTSPERSGVTITTIGTLGQFGDRTARRYRRQLQGRVRIHQKPGLHEGL